MGVTSTLAVPPSNIPDPPTQESSTRPNSQIVMSRRSTTSNLSPHANKFSPANPQPALTPSGDFHYTPSRSTSLSTPYPHGPSYTNSRTWVSPRVKEKDEWKHLHNGLVAMNLNQPDHSPFVPKTFDAYLRHKADFLSDRQKEMQHACRASASGNKHLDTVMGGKSYSDSRGAVLGMETVWCQWDKGTKEHPQAPWPTEDEMREEGDERHTSQFGRFLALPRNPGNETVTFKQRSPIKQHHLDRVWDVPLPDDEGELVEEEVMEKLIGDDLLRELDV
ncbi:MAG: hypothetical protein Q9220_006609 [cf. Caloplaca sp. 1 TL-2023]